MKKMVIVVAVILGVIGGLILFKNIIARNIVSREVKAITGLTLEIGSLDIGVFKPVVAVSNLKIFNPPDYQDKLMAELPVLYADYDLGAFLKGKVHFRQLQINIKSLEVVKDAKARVNLESLEALKPKGTGPAPEIKIDKLVLDIGKVSYKDYSIFHKPKISEFNLNIHETYENIDNPQSLVNIILSKALMNTTIGNLEKLGLTPLKNELSNVRADIKQSVKVKIKDALRKLIPVGK